AGRRPRREGRPAGCSEGRPRRLGAVRGAARAGAGVRRRRARPGPAARRAGDRRGADHHRRRPRAGHARARHIRQLRRRGVSMTTPVLTSVIASRLKTIGERMGVVVERSARSPLLVEGRDFSLGIYAPDGTLIEQTEYIPVLGYATTPGLRAI